MPNSTAPNSGRLRGLLRLSGEHRWLHFLLLSLVIAYNAIAL